MSVIVYLRVSSTKQTNKFSLDTQLQQIRQALPGNTEFKIFTDVGSARYDVMPMNHTIMMGSARKNTTIWVHRYDRFGRNYTAAINNIKALLKKGAIVRSADPNEINLGDYQTNDESWRKICDIFRQAQVESDNISRNVKAVRQAIIASGGCPHAPPFATQLTDNYKKRTADNVVRSMSTLHARDNYTPPMRQLEPNPQEARVYNLVKMMVDGGAPVAAVNSALRSVSNTDEKKWEPLVFYNVDGSVATNVDAGLTAAETAAWLNEYRVPYRKNIAWNAGIITRMLKNETITKTLQGDNTNAELDNVLDNLNKRLKIGKSK